MKFESGKINTSPAFQRHSVWKKPDRLKLINLILNNKPIPTIFFYERNDDNGNKIYDVIDGKQRLETIVKYFDPKNIKQLDPIQGKFIQDSKYIEVVEFKSLDKDKKSQFTGYKIALIQVSGEYEDILNLFININSLGAPLKTSEIRNAKFIQSPWIKYINDFQKNKTGNKKLILVNEIFKRNNVDRMAKEEFILELLISVFTEEVHDGKTILDKILSDRTSRLSQTKKKEFINTLVWINQIFTIADIKSTRLKNKSDFYSLFFVLSEFYRNGIVTNDSITNKMIHGLILSFLNSVDMYNSHKKTKANDWIKSYSDTVTKGTDQKQQRLIRNDIIRQLLINLPHKTRDKNRTFSELQKHILWHNFRNNPKCSGKKCGGKTLTWDDVTIDHVKAWIKGGCTSLDNAQILCRECNSSKKDK